MPVRINPSILAADFANLQSEIARIHTADLVHVDVMDNHFVPNLTFGQGMVERLQQVSSLPLDVHLMIDDPRRYVARFRDAGADWLTIHLEADRHPHRTLGQIRELGTKAGLALNPGTPVALVEDLVEQLDLLLIMSVNPGFGGQPFIPTALEKLRQAQRLLAERNPACELEVDGGVNQTNAAAIARAGASVVVAGSFVFLEGDSPEANIAALRRALGVD
jgi:ribulose-phosphate 3-epimerase